MRRSFFLDIRSGGSDWWSTAVMVELLEHSLELLQSQHWVLGVSDQETLLQIIQIGQSSLRIVLKPALRNLCCSRNVFVASWSVLWPLAYDISAGRPSMGKLVSSSCGLQSSCGNISKIIQRWWRSPELKFNRRVLSPNVNDNFENKSAFILLEYWLIDKIQKISTTTDS